MAITPIFSDYNNLFLDTRNYKAPVNVSDLVPQVNLEKREAWRQLGVNVGALRTSLPDFEWIYSTIKGPTSPPGGSGGKLHSFTNTMRLENFYFPLNLFRVIQFFFHSYRFQ